MQLNILGPQCIKETQPPETVRKQAVLLLEGIIHK